MGHKKSELDGAKAVGMMTIAMFPDSDLLENDGALIKQYDYYVSGWKHLASLAIWPTFIPQHMSGPGPNFKAYKEYLF